MSAQRGMHIVQTARRWRASRCRLHCRFTNAVGSHVLLAIGRRPNTDDLGVDKAGIELDERGYIKVNDQLETNVPGIWALGDCNGRGAFTHTAYNDFEIVAQTSSTAKTAK